MISNRFTFDPQRMTVVSVGFVTTLDTLDTTVLLKEKGTLNFTRNDGVFVGKYTATFPSP